MSEDLKHSENLEHSERIAGLILKYYREDLDDAEYQELMIWYNLSDENRQFFDRFSDSDLMKNKIKKLRQFHDTYKKPGWEKILAAIAVEDPTILSVPPRQIKWMRYLLAASLTGVLIAGAWIYVKHQSVSKTNIPSQIASNNKTDLAPGGNKAILTLAGGQQLILDQAQEGQLATQGATKITKLKKGILSYSINSDEAPGKTKEEISYNTLTVPKGGIYQVVLPDHSTVYLNSASSLRYPTSFNPLNSRTVELSGEAFFDIKKDPARPFQVLVNGVTVNVLGTSFNINAYPDEPTIGTTLLEGAVSVKAKGTSLTLKPGQQAQIKDQEVKCIQHADVEAAMAWKNGHFHFDQAPIQSVMRQLARWYDVEIFYKGNVTNHLFSGDIQRNLSFAQVADILSDHVHFTVKKKVVTVVP